MQATKCPECGSQYFRQLDRFDAQGQKMVLTEKEPVMLQCSNCNNMFTIQDGTPRTFTESRREMPKAMQEGVTMKPVDEGGPVG